MGFAVLPLLALRRFILYPRFFEWSGGFFAVLSGLRTRQKRLADGRGAIVGAEKARIGVDLLEDNAIRHGKILCFTFAMRFFHECKPYWERPKHRQEGSGCIP